MSLRREGPQLSHDALSGSWRRTYGKDLVVGKMRPDCKDAGRPACVWCRAGASRWRNLRCARLQECKWTRRPMLLALNQLPRRQFSVVNRPVTLGHGTGDAGDAMDRNCPGSAGGGVDGI
jgi:hypothetical protein